ALGLQPRLLRLTRLLLPAQLFLPTGLLGLPGCLRLSGRLRLPLAFGLLGRKPALLRELLLPPRGFFLARPLLCEPLLLFLVALPLRPCEQRLVDDHRLDREHLRLRLPSHEICTERER